MVRFVSPRERHLWWWAATVLLAIYASVGLAGILAGALRARGLLAVAFTLAFLGVIGAVVGSALKHRAGRRELWVTVGVTAVWAMVVVRMGVSPEERTHLFEYGLLAALIYHALLERRGGGERVPAPGISTMAIVTILGWLDEGMQSLLPNRVYDLRDVGTNALAGFMAVAATAVIMTARRWDRFRGRSGTAERRR